MRQLGKITVFNCILYDASRRMANKLLFYSITHSVALNFDVFEFLRFLKAQIHLINKFQSP